MHLKNKHIPRVLIGVCILGALVLAVYAVPNNTYITAFSTFTSRKTSPLIFPVINEENRIVIETEHMPVLLSHQHDAGEAVEDKGHHAYLMGPTYVAPRDLWIREMTFDIINAPDTAVHHTALLQHNTPHQTCPLPYLQLAGFAQDMMHSPRVPFPDGAGMRIPKGAPFQFLLMVHNPLPPVGPGEIYKDVYGELTISLYPEERQNLKEVKFHLIHLDQHPCQDVYSDGTAAFLFTVPPNSKDYSFTSRMMPGDPSHFTFAKDSLIVYAGGHLHGWQGGKKLFVKKNGDTWLEMDTRPSPDYPFRYDSDYKPVSLSVQAGDTLTLEAIYDNPHDVPTRGAMGMLEMYYYER